MNHESNQQTPAPQVAAVIESCEQLMGQLSRQVIGQQEVLGQLLLALFARGHCLLVGVPGLAKTLMVRTLARALQLDFRRIQFTPDLMPSDITGTEMIQQDSASGERVLRFRPGPVFANILLADEINRTPPKTQAALLEAMQESSVTVGGESHPLPDPFFVLATQNPIEQEGTYPLPEAQLDRFMFHVQVDYPDRDEELAIIKQMSDDRLEEIQAVMDAERICQIGELVRQLPIADHVASYGLGLVRASRPDREEATDMVREYISWGAGPRAGQYLVLGAKAHALLDGRYAVEYADIDAVAHPVLRHRLRLNFQAEAAGLVANDVIDHLLEHVRNSESSEHTDGRLPNVFGSEGTGQS
jgi:MoxR-like ATPase